MESESRAHILVIDDEPRVAEAIARILCCDHDAEIITRPHEALARITAGEPFDVILCDVMMPEMMGFDLHAAVARVAPEMADRFVFMTGGILTLRAREFLKRVPNACLDKPLDTNRLREILMASLAARHARESGAFAAHPQGPNVVSR